MVVMGGWWFAVEGLRGERKVREREGERMREGRQVRKNEVWCVGLYFEIVYQCHLLEKLIKDLVCTPNATHLEIWYLTAFHKKVKRVIYALI